MDIKHDLTQLIGSTPLVELTRYNALHQLPARLVLSALTILQVQGYVREESGKRFSLAVRLKME